MSRFDPERKTSSRDFRFNEAKQLDEAREAAHGAPPRGNAMSEEAVESTAIVHASGAVPSELSPIFGTSDPEAVVEKAAQVATALKKVIDQKGLAVTLKAGADPFLELEAWLLFGASVGVSVGTGECKRDPESTVESWVARATVYNRSGQVIGHAEGTCGRDESNWRNRDTYALKSMAQTRAASQAMRRALGFLAVLAGYNPTPAAEMPRESDQALSGGQSGRPQPPRATPGARNAGPTPPEISYARCPNCDQKAVRLNPTDGTCYCWKKAGGCGVQWTSRDALKAAQDRKKGLVVEESEPEAEPLPADDPDALPF